MNLKLQHVISDITGLTGMRIIEAILKGERDPRKLAELRHERCKNSVETIARALTGTWREEHLFALQQEYDLYQKYQEMIQQCGQKIEQELTRFPDRRPAPSEPLQPSRSRPNQPTFNMREAVYRMSGVDLTVIEGIEAYTALLIVSELGTDWSKSFPTENQFVSWLTLCPGTNKTGGKPKDSRTRKSANRVAAALRLCANSLHHSDSALGAYLRRMKMRLGKAEAITARPTSWPD
jgi:transposase